MDPTSYNDDLKYSNHESRLPLLITLLNQVENEANDNWNF